MKRLAFGVIDVVAIYAAMSVTYQSYGLALSFVAGAAVAIYGLICFIDGMVRL